MDSSIDVYEVEFTKDCIDEMYEIYNYISKELIASQSAKKLMQQVKENVLALEWSPRLYSKIEKKDKLEREYRRMVIKNYVLLYTIDECDKIIYVSHMYYRKQNYM